MNKRGEKHGLSRLVIAGRGREHVAKLDHNGAEQVSGGGRG